jgi:hypothetical protein
MKRRFFKAAKQHNVEIIKYSSLRGDMGWHAFSFTVTFGHYMTSFTESYIVGKGENEKIECLKRFENELIKFKKNKQ